MNAIHSTGEKVEGHGKKALIVTDSFLSTTETMKNLQASLKEKGVDYEVIDNVVPNPLDSDIHDAVKIYQEKNCDMLIGFGGGSSIDSAKAIGAIAANGGETKDLIEEDSIKNDLPPLVAIPTTAGTGSEVTIFSVITDSKSHEKLILFNDKLIPKTAILDPWVTVYLPPKQTAFTGLDAFTHALEAFTVSIANPVCDGIAFEGMRLIVKYLEESVNNSSNIEARSGMLLGSHLAGIGFSNTDLGSIHTMGETLASKVNLSHGLAMEIFLPYIMKENLPSAIEKYSKVATLFGIDSDNLGIEAAANKCIEQIVELERRLEIPFFDEVEGVKTEDFDGLALLCKEHVCDEVNPQPISEKRYRELYMNAYNNVLELTARSVS